MSVTHTGVHGCRGWGTHLGHTGLLEELHEQALPLLRRLDVRHAQLAEGELAVQRGERERREVCLEAVGA